MKVLAVNGSPRKGGSTFKLLSKAAEGAASLGGEVEWVNLYDYDYKGCTSCFACKRLPNPSKACAYQDDLTPILQKSYNADVLLLGTPVFFANYSSGMRAYLERLLYKYPHNGAAPTKKAVGCVYAMNAGKEQVESLNYRALLGSMETFLKRAFGDVQTIWSMSTYQFQDYAQYEHNQDISQRALIRDTQFPKDLEAARKMGADLAQFI